MDFNFLVDFIILADELLDSILLDHVEDIPLGVEIGCIDVHIFKLCT